MKLYMHPVSNTSRPVRMFIADNNLPVEEEVVDLMTGAHHQEPYISLNPNRQVPTLVDGDFVLERKLGDPEIPRRQVRSRRLSEGPKKRAKVNEMMDWFNTALLSRLRLRRRLPADLPAPQAAERRAAEGHNRLGKEQTKKWLKVLNDNMLGKGNKYLTGNELTIADYFRRGAADLGRFDPHRVQGLPEHPGVAGPNGGNAELVQVQRGPLGFS